MQVLFFGKLRDMSDGVEFTGAPGVTTVAHLRDWFAEQSPLLAEALNGPGVRAAVDQRFVDDATSLTGAKEVAFMPPLSGG